MAMEITSANFEQEVLNSPVPVLVDFWASWCMPCKMLAPAIEELSQEANGAYKVGKIDVDAAPDLAARFGVMNIPTVLVFQGGQVVKKSVGVVPKQQLADLLK
ncbi:MAG TPA: thioredoxin [Candidatus Blautia merdavium]|uniref:Thioredoxin n=1 Tax=Candidatus Blautia merdavium TaxID=2838494 RepID=A0A9D2PNI8_9FIRM|nr:thioredoxin [Candidatus Blautia merdavium]